MRCPNQILSVHQPSAVPSGFFTLSMSHKNSHKYDYPTVSYSTLSCSIASYPYSQLLYCAGERKIIDLSRFPNKLPGAIFTSS